MACTMNEYHSHAQGAQDGNIEENVGEILRGGHASIHRNHEDTLPEAGNILEDFSEIGNVQ